MRKTFWAILIVAFLLLSSTDSKAQVAIGGAGIYRGFDLFSMDAEDNTQFLLADKETNVSLKRQRIENPSIFGGRIFVNLLPKTSIEFSFDGIADDYKFTFTNANTLESVKGSGRFLKFAFYTTLTRDLLKFPRGVKGVTIYAGAGAGFNLIRLPLSHEIIASNLDKWTRNLDANDVADIEVGATGHGLIGLKIRPSLIPFSIDGGIRYTSASQDKFAEAADFFSIFGGVSLRLLPR